MNPQEALELEQQLHPNKKGREDCANCPFPGRRCSECINGRRNIKSIFCGSFGCIKINQTILMKGHKMNPQEALTQVEEAIKNHPELVSNHWGLFWKDGKFLVWPSNENPKLTDLVCFVPDPNLLGGYTYRQWSIIRDALAHFLKRKEIK